MNDLPNTTSNKKLPVWATIREALEFWRDHWTTLWQWIILGAIIGGLAGSFLEFFNSNSLETEKNTILTFGEVVGIALGISSIPISIFLAIACHRLILLEHEKVAYHTKFKFSEREFNFFWYLLVIFCGLILVGIPGLIIFEIIPYAWNGLHQVLEEKEWMKELVRNVIVYLPWMYFVGRYGLVFPAIAVDRNKECSWQRDLDWSWKMSKGNEWRLALLVGGLPLVLDWVATAISMLGIGQWVYIDCFVSAFLGVASIPIEVAVLSIAFRELTNWTPSSQLPQST